MNSPTRQRNALVQTGQPTGSSVVIHQHGDVVHRCAKIGSNLVQRICNQLLKPLNRDDDHVTIMPTLEPVRDVWAGQTYAHMPWRTRKKPRWTLAI